MCVSAVFIVSGVLAVFSVSGVSAVLSVFSVLAVLRVSAVFRVSSYYRTTLDTLSTAYALCEYAMGRASTVCDTRIGYTL